MAASSNWKKFLEVNGGTTTVGKGSTESADTGKIGLRVQRKKKSPKSLLKQNVIKSRKDDQQLSRLTQAVALDCEMVGIHDGKENMLARVSIVNSHGQTVYDTFVKPTEPVVDYRTAVSGVRSQDLDKGVEFHIAQKTVATILKGRILVGHALRNDLGVLFLSHPRRNTRDTSRYGPFQEMVHSRRPSLKKLASEILGAQVQQGEHSSVEDARATMHLYNMYKKEWESSLA
ncbi:RNA exonuclease 4 isoform X2 [Hetaerina americana]|uniref:RNA exonuclease 4 isoform X2 n=1 Tax=Hetaerina americana TaxID=62018 RepID=UPI003A7F420D